MEYYYILYLYYIFLVKYLVAAFIRGRKLLAEPH